MSEEKIFYFVDNKKYETEETSLTGAQIKESAGIDPSYGLFLEAKGDEPDKQIADDKYESMEKDKGPKRFYSVPGATFGIKCQ